MARFSFNLALPAARDPSHPMIAARVLRSLSDGVDDDVRRGPGWFDSSWDLRRGLDVREGLPGDARLNEWLEACLRG